MRLMWVILRQLLRDPASAVARAVDPVGTAWSSETYVLADVADILMAANFKDPKPYPRPDDAQRAAAAEQQRREALLAQRERIRARQQAEGAT